MRIERIANRAARLTEHNTYLAQWPLHLRWRKLDAVLSAYQRFLSMNDIESLPSHNQEFQNMQKKKSVAEIQEHILLCGSWLAHLSSPQSSLAVGTKDSYTRAVILWKKYLLSGGKPSPLGVKKWIRIQEENMASSTVQVYFYALSAMYRWAVKNSICEDVTSGQNYQAKKTAGKRKKKLSVRDVAQIYRSIGKSTEGECRDRAILSLLFSSMISTGALTSLKISDVNIEALTVVFKSRSMITTMFMAAISKQASEAICEYLKFRPNATKSEPLFTTVSNNSRIDKSLTTRTVQRIMNDYIGEHIKNSLDAKSTPECTPQAIRDAALSHLKKKFRAKFSDFKIPLYENPASHQERRAIWLHNVAQDLEL